MQLHQDDGQAKAKHKTACQALRAANTEERRLIVASYAKKTFVGWSIGATYKNQGDIPPRSLIGTITKVRFKGNRLTFETNIMCPTKRCRGQRKLIAYTSIKNILAAFLSRNQISEVLEHDMPFLAHIHLMAPKPKPH